MEDPYLEFSCLQYMEFSSNSNKLHRKETMQVMHNFTHFNVIKYN